jgi:hypothetical protein
MIKTRIAKSAALDVAQFHATHSHDLAVVVHRETEAARAADVAKLEAEHGEFMPNQNLLMALTRPASWCASTNWSEYLTDETLRRCAAVLKISTGALLKRIVSELHPANWEVLFWRGAWHRQVEESSLEVVDLEMRLEEQAEKFEAQKRANAKAGGHASHEKEYGSAKAFVLAEWTKHKDSYGGNKTAFARHYVLKVKAECDRVVTQRTIANSWLAGQ